MVAKDNKRKIYYVKNNYNQSSIFLSNPNNIQSLSILTASLTLEVVYTQRTDCCMIQTSESNLSTYSNYFL